MPDKNPLAKKQTTKSAGKSTVSGNDGFISLPGKRFLPALIIFLAAFTLYSGTLKHGYVLDDFNVLELKADT